MGDVLTFTPRPKPAAADFRSEPLTGPALRASLEEAAQVALDAADRIMAVLDRMDGDADLEDGGDDEPSLAAPENTAGSQVVWMRGNDQDREAETPETVLPEVETDVMPALPWGGRGNVLAAAGAALLEMVGEGGRRNSYCPYRCIHARPQPVRSEKLGAGMNGQRRGSNADLAKLG